MKHAIQPEGRGSDRADKQFNVRSCVKGLSGLRLRFQASSIEENEEVFSRSTALPQEENRERRSCMFLHVNTPSERRVIWADFGSRTFDEACVHHSRIMRLIYAKATHANLTAQAFDCHANVPQQNPETIHPANLHDP